MYKINDKKIPLDNEPKWLSYLDTNSWSRYNQDYSNADDASLISLSRKLAKLSEENAIPSAEIVHNLINNTQNTNKTTTTIKENKNNMFNFESMFNGMFKPVSHGCCKMGMNGQIAIKTSTGYKTFNVKSKKLTNCDNFAFDMDGAFWVVPTFKVEVGDVILVGGKPRCVIEIGANTIKTLSYEDTTIDEIIPESHVFMGKTYCYGKIFSPFMNMTKKDGTMQSMMNMMMMSQMFGGKPGDMGNFNPMMFMMMSGKTNMFEDMFDGAFDFGFDADADTADEKVEKE